VFSPSRMGYRVEEAKEIREEASLTPNTGRKKFLILDRADRINPESANRLLKIIEEPPEFTIFVLLTENPHRILPTIRSRSMTVSFRPLSLKESLDALGDRIPADRVNYLYSIAKGNLGWMLQLSGDEKLKELFEGIEAEVKERLLKEVPASPIRLAEEIAELAGRVAPPDSEDETESSLNRKSVVTVLEIVMSVVEEEYMPAAVGRAARAVDPAVHRTGSQLLESVVETIRSIEGGGHVALCLEAMAMDFRRISSGIERETALWK